MKNQNVYKILSIREWDEAQKLGYINTDLDKKDGFIHFSNAKTAGDKVLDAYYLKFIIWNLKLILKGKVLGKTQEELETKINLHAEELIKQRDIILKALVAYFCCVRKYTDRVILYLISSVRQHREIINPLKYHQFQR